MLRNLVLSAAAAGLVAGLFTAGLQHVTTTPIIIAAEAYEGGGSGHDHAVPGVAPAEPAVAVAGPDGAEHDQVEGWSPADGLERTLYTSLATSLTGIGFALALLGAMTLAGVRIDARSGLAFGVAGFAACALAPALGLPPEIPGSGAAELADRQAWWLMTAALTAGGLAALLLGRGAAIRIAGAGALFLPHLVGAPHPAAYASTAPAELAGHFAAASLVVTGVFWAVLGSASGAAFRRIAGPA